MIQYFGHLFHTYPIISVEDGLAESDWKGFVRFTQKFGKTHQIVGDDLTVTNAKILAEAIEKKQLIQF